MKKTFFFTIFILGLFVFQNSYSEEPHNVKRFAYTPASDFILWRVYTKKAFDSVGVEMIVDSVLRGKKNLHVYADRKWYFSNRTKPGIEFHLVPNTYYLVLTDATCPSSSSKKCHLRFYLKEGDCALPDTQENRELLSKKWDNTKTTDEPLKPRIEGRYIDM